MQDAWFTDWTPSERFPAYSRPHAREAIADPVCPLTWTLLWEQAMIPGWRDAHLAAGLLLERELPEHRPPVCATFGGYLYVNLSCIRTWAGRLPDAGAQAVKEALIGEHPGMPAGVAHPDDADPGAVAAVARSLHRVLSAEDFPEMREQRARAGAARRSRTDLTYLTPAELVQRARGLLPLLRETFAGAVAAGVWSLIGPGMLRAMAPRLGEDVEPLRLIAGLGALDSAEASLALWDLSRLVAGSPDLTLYFDGGVPGILGRLDGSPSDDAKGFLDAFDTFLYEHGSGGRGRWDIRSDVWETDPELALALLERVRFVADHADPRRRHEALAAEREETIARVSERLAGDREAAGPFAAAVRASRVFLVARERARTNAVKVTNEIRIAIRELGRQMADAHHIADADLVMMLTAAELDDFVAHPAPFGLELAERARAHASLADLEPPSFVVGTAPPLSAWPRRTGTTAEPAAAGDVLGGMPGSPGTGRGRARVVDDVLPATFEPGDILVVPTADASWAPLFVAAGAVVVDTDRPDSPAVLVSRELGVPAVALAGAATGRIADDVAVSVDGHRGTVTIL